MDKHQFYRQHQHLNIDERELERKYLAHIREQEEMQRMFEAAVIAQRSQSSTAGGGSATDSSGSTNGSTWSYVVEAENGNYLIGVLDYPLNKFSQVIDTGLNSNDSWFWNDDNFNGTYVIQDKGYMMWFTNNFTNDDYLFFIDAGGKLVGRIDASTDRDLYLDLVHANVIVIEDDNSNDFWWFDGYTLTFDDSGKNPTGQTIKDGWFSRDYTSTATINGDIQTKQYYINKGGEFFEVFSGIISQDGEPINSYSIEAYENSNIFRIFRYDEIGQYWANISYYDSSGNLLHSQDLEGNTQNFNSFTSQCYGTGKHLDVFYNDDQWLVCYYDEGSNQLMTHSQENRTDYSGIRFHCNYISSGSFYDYICENSLIAFYNYTGGEKGLDKTTFCNFLPIFEGQNDINDTIVFADGGGEKLFCTSIGIGERFYIPVCTDISADPKILTLLTIEQSTTATSPVIDFAEFDTIYDSRCEGRRYL